MHQLSLLNLATCQLLSLPRAPAPTPHTPESTRLCGAGTAAQLGVYCGQECSPACHVTAWLEHGQLCAVLQITEV